MIRFIAAIDNKQGLADEHGIPWQGKIPRDVKHFREKTQDAKVLMGYGTYKEFDKPLNKRINYVASRSGEDLKDGFEPVNDAKAFLHKTQDDVWVIGGAGLFNVLIDFADELYLTQLDKDFHCTKFFPDFKDKFTLQDESEPITENGITYTFQRWAKQ